VSKLIGPVYADDLCKQAKKKSYRVLGVQLSEVQPLLFFSVDSASSWTWSITPCSHIGGAAQMFVRRLLFAKIWLLQSDDIWHLVSLWRYSPVQQFVHSFQQTVVDILDSVDSEVSRDPPKFWICTLSRVNDNAFVADVDRETRWSGQHLYL